MVIKGERYQEPARPAQTVIVCDTCKQLAGVIGRGKFDWELAMLNLQNLHFKHDFTTINVRKGRYFESRGISVWPVDVM